jgi:Leucine-rich repeat (LRR) protein
MPAITITVNLITKSFETWFDIQTYFDKVGRNNIFRLQLNNNRLTSLPDRIFSGLTTLQSLWLHNNQLTSLPDGIFSGLVSLRVLRLHNNQLASLPEGIFSGLVSLRVLKLYDNQLTSLPEGIFSGLASLQTLWIHNNFLESSPGIVGECDVFFTPQYVTLEKVNLLYTSDEPCVISHEPLSPGCEYRMCSNPIKFHAYLSEIWMNWEKMSKNAKCVLCKEWGVIPKIFINAP